MEEGLSRIYIYKKKLLRISYTDNSIKNGTKDLNRHLTKKKVFR